jgi:hypothetical protein
MVQEMLLMMRQVVGVQFTQNAAPKKRRIIDEVTKVVGEETELSNDGDSSTSMTATRNQKYNISNTLSQTVQVQQK